MCGIAGELRWDGLPAEEAVVRRMGERLARRGPDAAGFWSDGAVALAHRRLSIIDLSTRSNQPMLDPVRGVALVFNGTIYNYPALRKTLHALGHSFVSDGDTETILRAYIQWGEDCVDHLDGVFAFALRDTRNRTLFLARDRLGIKPLYFARLPGRCRFASTVQALLSGGDLSSDLDPIALHHHFTLHSSVPAPFTVLKAVRKLEQGTTLTLDDSGNERSRRYWSLNAQREVREDWEEALHATLSAAVKKRIEIADVKVGVLLSGGLDSSLLVALAAEQGATDLMTFSIGFEDQPEEKGNEFEYSDLVADHFGTRHHRLLIPNAEVLRRLPEAVAASSEPMASQDVISFYLLSEWVSKTVKVVLSGQGADEVFAGYSWHQKIVDMASLRHHYFDRDHAEFTDMFEPTWRTEDVTSALMAKKMSEPLADEFIDQLLRAETTLFVTDDPVKRVDNMTMSWGLEARVPFLDASLVELVAQMPPHLKLGSGGKHILKRLARNRLPDAVIDRPKGYFPMPALKHVRGEFLTFMRDLLNSTACRQRGLYRRAYVERLLAEPEQHLTRIQGNKLWHLALLELWLQSI
ncbi:MAG: N-acetylglutaminylglutamine amidotransferase [Rhodocyclaceae bacterium]|nr:N-acetylglutaminylglutamine amidotransferase [Rhodocyclaceae bacterium]